ncbi:MAG TPA: diguanylate cyclase [Solirubrobacteraceae bacterium]|nr:diguanylate cyclase [Solirubrobacteraceae bacterium]
MAASDSTQGFPPAAPGAFDWPGAVELDERLSEEIGRAERHGTQLSCLLVVVDNLEEMAGEHGGELREQTMAYIAGALRRELRRFDRVGMPSDRELLIVLPGADGPRGEMVARRVLDRLRSIKVEARGRREALRISVGLSAWRPEATPRTLIGRARAAAERSANGGPDAPGPVPDGAEGESTAPPS